MLFFELRGCLSGNVFKYPVKCRFGIESSLEGYSQNGIFLVAGVDNFSFHFFNPVVVDKIKKVLTDIFINHLR